MQRRQIETDADGYERAGHGSAAFPIQAYENNMWLFPTRDIPWHWHEECELIYVAQGSVSVRAAETGVVLKAGQGAFVNSNELHTYAPACEGACNLDSIVFDPSIIGGAPYSVFQLKYVAPVYRNASIRAVHLTGAEPWHMKVLEALKQVRPVFETDSFEREMELRTLLSQVWMGMLRHAETEAPALQPATDPHIRTMMLYIHNHYTEPLTLKDIADSASVSVRTCSRSFRKQLGMSVFGYLMSHRVKQAAQLLATTEDPITDICFATGFADAAYFSRVFRSVTGQTPTAFRKDAVRAPQRHSPGQAARKSGR